MADALGLSDGTLAARLGATSVAGAWGCGGCGLVASDCGASVRGSSSIECVDGATVSASGPTLRGRDELRGTGRSLGIQRSDSVVTGGGADGSAAAGAGVSAV